MLRARGKNVPTRGTDSHEARKGQAICHVVSNVGEGVYQLIVNEIRGAGGRENAEYADTSRVNITAPFGD